ncbi:MAG: EamA family transporter [Candidatus Thorarchaeota archaeon]|nr:EamA family transporter [Candidatus Thorarchaeota archaeon]
MQVTPEMMMGVATGLLATAIYAVSVVVYRSQSDSIRPMAISSIKMWVALAFMTALVVLPIRSEPFFIPQEALAYLILSVIFGAVLGDYFYITAQERIGVSYAFPIAMSFPIFTYLLAIAVGFEEPLLSRSAGILLTVIGVILVSKEQGHDEDHSVKRKFDKVGVGLALLVAIFFAIGAILLQVGVEDVSPIDANFVRVAFGSVAFIPMFLIAKHRGMPTPPQRTVKIISIAGLLGMGLGSLLYVSTIKFVGAAVTSVLGSLSPLFALPISIVFLKERITRVAMLGVVATIAGVILVILGA